jgi:NADH-quinone oxidoreductase subunit G
MTTVENTPADIDAPPPDPNAVNVTINGKPFVARKGELVISAAERAGEYIPHFCYHSRMTPVGKCRMCLVEADGGRGPAVTVSCMVPVSPDMKIDTDSPMAKRMQEGMLELLLANHPLDCPVCDKGGECPLQDQTVSHGPGESRFVEEKRHYEKPIPISDLVFLDRERCILCDRCTRFADEVAGDPLIHFTHRGNTTQVQTFPDEPFSSYFSGNTVQICPVGALTAKPYRFKARPWDLEQVSSTCTTCSVGCRTVVQSSRDELLRYQGHDSDAVNWGWLCDKGRFNFEAPNSDQRLGNPAIKQGDGLVETGWSTAYAKAAELIKATIASDGPGGVAIIGGAHGTNEDAYAWGQLAHDVIGTPHIYAQLLDSLHGNLLNLPRATIGEAASAATIVLLCGDLKEEMPVLYLRLKDAAAKKRSKILEFTPRSTGMSKYAWKSILSLPGEQAKAVRQAVTDTDIATQLAKGPVVVVIGKGNYAESGSFQTDALASILAAVPDAKVLPAYRRGNVVGALQLGWMPGEGGNFTHKILESAAEGKIGTLIMVGADPLHDFPDTDLVRRGLAGARSIIAVDTFVTESSRLADVIFPAAAYGEKSGTTTNIENRVSPVTQKVTEHGTSRPDWMIATELSARLGTDLGYNSVDDVTDAIAANVPDFAPATREAVMSADDGVLAVPSVTTTLPVKMAEAQTLAGYDFRLVTGRKLYDQAIGTQMSESLAALAQPAALHLHPLDLERFGSDGVELKVTSSKNTLVMPAIGDAGLPRGAAFIEFNQSNIAVGELIDCNALVIDLKIETF